MHHMKPGAVSMGKVFYCINEPVCVLHGKTMEEDTIKKY